MNPLSLVERLKALAKRLENNTVRRRDGTGRPPTKASLDGAAGLLEAASELQAARDRIAELEEALTAEGHAYEDSLAREDEWAAEQDKLTVNLSTSKESRGHWHARAMFAEQRNAELEEAIFNAAKVFREYEAMHLAKDTQDGKIKAARNAMEAEELETVLRKASAPRGEGR